MTDRQKIVKKRIGELLIERGIITQQQLDEALKIQTEKKKLLGEILLDLGYVTEEEVMIALTTQYGMPFLPLENYEIDSEIIKTVPVEIAKKYNFIPVDKIGDLLTIVIADVPDIEVTKEIEEVLKCKVEIFITTPSALRNAAEKYYK